MTRLRYGPDQEFDGVINRFDPAYWTIDMAIPIDGALITNGTDGLDLYATFYKNDDAISLNWFSDPSRLHSLFRYEVNRNYFGCVLTFDYTIRGLVRPFGVANGPSLNLINSLGHIFIVDLKNYMDPGSGEYSGSITLDFNEVRAGSDASEFIPWQNITHMFFYFIPDFYGGSRIVTKQNIINGQTSVQIYVPSGILVEAGDKISFVGAGNEKQVISSIAGGDRHSMTIILSTGVETYNGLPSGTGAILYKVDNTVIVIPHEDIKIEFRNISCTGDGSTLGIRTNPLDIHDIKMTDGYDNSYPLTPKRVVDGIIELGYRNWYNEYIGITHMHRLIYDDTHGGPKIGSYHNDIIYSSAIDDANWVKTGLTVTNVNSETDPKGNSKADEITLDAGSSAHYIEQTITVTPEIKRWEAHYIKALTGDNGSRYISFVLKTATKTRRLIVDIKVEQVIHTYDDVGGTDSLIPLEDYSFYFVGGTGYGWYKLVLAITPASGETSLDHCVVFTNSFSPSVDFPVWNATGSERIALWGGFGVEADYCGAHMENPVGTIVPYNMCEPARQFHLDLFSRLKAVSILPIISVSFEVLADFLPDAWRQQDYAGVNAHTGWSPPSGLISPSNFEALDWLVGIYLELFDLGDYSGTDVNFQVGEPWWWDGSYMAGLNRAFIYDDATTALYVVETGLPVPTPYLDSLEATLDSNQRDYLDWCGEKLGASCHYLRDQVKAVYPNSTCYLLTYPPQYVIVTNEIIQRINLPVTYFQSPEFDKIQLEDYDRVAAGDFNFILRETFRIGQNVLGYSNSDIQYFSGWVAAEQAGWNWRNIDRALQIVEEEIGQPDPSWSAAHVLLGNYEGFAVDFSQRSMYVKDLVTPANNYDGRPEDHSGWFLTGGGQKYILGADGFYSLVDDSAGPFYEYDIIQKKLGLRVDPQTVNRALHNRDRTDAVWVATNMDVVQDQIGIDGFVNKACTLTATANNATILQTVVGLTSSAYYYSDFIKRLNGSGIVEITIDGGATWIDVSNNIDTRLFHRVSYSKDAVTSAVIGIRLNLAGDSVIVDMAQLEEALVTAPTTEVITANVTRGRSILGHSLADLPFADGGPATIIVEFVPFGGFTNVTDIAVRRVLGFTNGIDELEAVIVDYLSTLVPKVTVKTGGVSDLGVEYSDEISLIEKNVLIAAIDADNAYGTLNGVDPTSDSSGSLFASGAVTSIFYGTAIGGFKGMSGWIKRIAYIPQRLANNLLSIWDPLSIAERFVWSRDQVWRDGWVPEDSGKILLGENVCFLWHITRVDGIEHYFTTHDQNVIINGKTYIPVNSFLPGDIENSADASPDRLEVLGVTSDEITSIDLLGGLYENADVEISIADWLKPFLGKKIVRSGKIGAVTETQDSFRADCLGLAAQLNQSIGRQFQAGCDADLGDVRCTVNLDTYTEVGAVTGIPNLVSIARPGAVFPSSAVSQTGLTTNDSFVDTSINQDDDYFTYGKMTWTSGDNNGIEVEVYLYVNDAYNGPTFYLLDSMPKPIQVGDTYTVYRGCDKIFSTCKEVFNNAVNFRGFKDMPGNDALIQYPNAKT